MRLNPNFVNPILLDEPVRFGKSFTFYRLESKLPGFILSTRYWDTLDRIIDYPKNYFILRNVDIHIPNIEDKFSDYPIEIKGLLVPGAEGILYDFEESFTKIKYGKFKQKRVNPIGIRGESFKLTRNIIEGGKIVFETNYVVSPDHPKLQSILETLGAPPNLILD